MVNPFQSVFFFSLGTPVGDIGLLAAVSSIVTAFSYVLGGAIADAYGRKKIIDVFSVVAATSSFLYIFVFSWPLLFLPITVGALSGIYSPAFNATINDSIEPDLRPVGFASFTLLTTLPSIFSPYFGGLLIGKFGDVLGLKVGFFISGSLGLLGTVWRAKKLEETHQVKEKKLDLLDSFKGTFEAYKSASKTARRLLLYTLLASVATGLSTVYISLYVINSLKLSATSYGILIGLSSLVTVLLIMPAAGLVKRLGLKKAAVLSALFSPLSMLAFVSAAGMTDLVAWSVTGGISGALVSPSIQSLQGNLTNKEIRGRWMGMFALIPLLVAVPFQILSGLLYAVSPIYTFGLSIPFYVAAVYVLAKIEY